MSPIDFSEERLKQPKKPGMFFDKVDEDDRVRTHGVVTEIGPVWNWLPEFEE